MKTIDLHQASEISAGIFNLLHTHACQTAMETWIENYTTCRRINRILNTLVHYSLLDASTVELLEDKLPSHLQTCTTLESYLLANPEYQRFCD